MFGNMKRQEKGVVKTKRTLLYSIHVVPVLKLKYVWADKLEDVTKFYIAQLAFVYLIIMFKVNNGSHQEICLSCCFFDHVSSNINKPRLRLCYFRVAFHQPASPPGFRITHIPKGDLVFSYGIAGGSSEKNTIYM